MSNQFAYYATFQDDWLLLDEVLAPRDLRVFHDTGAFPTREIRYFDSLTEELKQLLQQVPGLDSLYVEGNFTRYPPQFYPIESGPWIGHFRIDVCHGGPLISLRLGVLRHFDEKDDPRPQPRLLCGEVAYEYNYKDPITGLYEPASAEVKAAYKSIVKRMKRHLKRYQQDGTNWFGPEAFALFKAGKAFIPSPVVPSPRGDDPGTMRAR